ncbi:conserved hypothetical protein [Vibrio phage 501E54-1]|nr:conserved hypothetical protein [Vibrio phage 501E54-1]
MTILSTPKIEVSICTPRTIRERLGLFLENQLNYCNESKRHHLESFKSELLIVMSKRGMTDEHLLLGLELNNYLRQVGKNNYQFTTVSYNLGEGT